MKKVDMGIYLYIWCKTVNQSQCQFRSASVVLIIKNSIWLEKIL